MSESKGFGILPLLAVGWMVFSFISDDDDKKKDETIKDHKKAQAVAVAEADVDAESEELSEKLSKETFRRDLAEEMIKKVEARLSPEGLARVNAIAAATNAKRATAKEESDKDYYAVEKDYYAVEKGYYD